MVDELIAHWDRLEASLRRGAPEENVTAARTAIESEVGPYNPAWHRDRALQFLINNPSESSAAILLKIVSKTEEDIDLRIAATRELGRIGSAAALPILELFRAEPLRSDEHKAIIAAAMLDIYQRVLPPEVAAAEPSPE